MRICPYHTSAFISYKFTLFAFQKIKLNFKNVYAGLAYANRLVKIETFH